MKKIALTQGYFAVVNNRDYDFLMQWNWVADKRKNVVYATRNQTVATNKTKKIYMHRVILGLTDRKTHVDHIDGNGLNNRRSNIRECTHVQNCMNKGVSKANTSGVRGICWSKKDKRWRVRIGHNGKDIGVGYFRSLEQARNARIKAETELYGEFSFFNKKAF